MNLDLPPPFWMPSKPAIIRPAADIRRANFLPGWFPGGAAAAKPQLTTISQISSATSTASTITAPAGINAGDLLVMLDFAFSGSTPATVVPTNFTSLSNITLGNIRQIASMKIADGTEGSSSITGMNGTSQVDKCLYVFRGNAPATSLVASTPNAEGTTGNPTAQNVAASGGVAPLVVIGCYGSTSVISPRTMSPAKDGEINAATKLYLAYKIYNSSPADVSVDMDDEDNNLLQSFYIQMAA